jgi:hypothetical protein
MKCSPLADQFIKKHCKSEFNYVNLLAKRMGKVTHWLDDVDVFELDALANALARYFYQQRYDCFVMPEEVGSRLTFTVLIRNKRTGHSQEFGGFGMNTWHAALLTAALYVHEEMLRGKS